VIEIRHYVDRKGTDVFDEWLTELADSRAQAKIAIRIDRLAAGNFGDTKSLRGGVCSNFESIGDQDTGCTSKDREGMRPAALWRR